MCRNCPCPIEAHVLAGAGSVCLTVFGAWGDSSFLDETHGDRCLCPGYEPGVTA